MAEEHLDIDRMIETLGIKIAAMQEAVASLRKVKDALGVAGVGMGSTVTSRGSVEIAVDLFVGMMSIVDAVEAYLKLVGRPARKTEDIIEALGQGGLRVSPASVTTLIWRSHNNDGPVVRVQKGHWGLAAWYPKRPPKLGVGYEHLRGDVSPREEAGGVDKALVKVFAHVKECDTEVDGALSMMIDKDEATDSYLGFMPALKLYSQGRTPQEAERLMEKAAALYLETAVREGQFSDILLARGFRRISGSGVEKAIEILSIRSISGQPRSAGSEESGMELEFAGAK